MPGAGQVLNYEKQRDKSDALLEQADILFCLDFNIFHRTKHMAEKLQQLNCIKVLMDHHQEPDAASFDYGVSDTSKSSTCEMVYDFINLAGDNALINLPISECIYAGVIGDTGSFRFSTTHAGVHSLVADLKSKGLDHGRIHEGLYDNFLENRLRFIGHVLLNRMEIFYEYNTALISISKADLQRFQIKTGDTEGLVNYGLAVRGINFSVLIVDRTVARKMSFRSKGKFPANEFAKTYFSGGGHVIAAGGESKDDIATVEVKFKEALIAYKHLLV
jgi:phosphoesterase RecJ-like protein